MQPKAPPEDFPGRFREIISDPLNLLIRRVPRAGLVEGDFVYLHNGLRVPLSGPNAYYEPFSSILVMNRGVHEPLEEFVFQEVLETLPRAPTMLELGAYWGHYSMWLKTARIDADVRMVEPELTHLQTGMKNFDLNGLSGEFIHLAVRKGLFEVDGYLKEQGIAKLDILHADIQGWEMHMLKECSHSLAARAIDYLFVSTHSQELHQQVMEVLGKAGYRVEVDADFEYGTTSYDGLVFASSPSARTIFRDFTPLGRVELEDARPATVVDYLAKTARSTSARGESALKRMLSRALRAKS